MQHRSDERSAVRARGAVIVAWWFACALAFGAPKNAVSPAEAVIAPVSASVAPVVAPVTTVTSTVTAPAAPIVNDVAASLGGLLGKRK
jgi:hypothetical protein